MQPIRQPLTERYRNRIAQPITQTSRSIHGHGGLSISLSQLSVPNSSPTSTPSPTPTSTSTAPLLQNDIALQIVESNRKGEGTHRMSNSPTSPFHSVSIDSNEVSPVAAAAASPSQPARLSSYLATSISSCMHRRKYSLAVTWVSGCPVVRFSVERARTPSASTQYWEEPVDNSSPNPASVPLPLPPLSGSILTLRWKSIIVLIMFIILVVTNIMDSYSQHDTHGHRRTLTFAREVVLGTHNGTSTSTATSTITARDDFQHSLAKLVTRHQEAQIHPSLVENISNPSGDALSHGGNTQEMLVRQHQDIVLGPRLSNTAFLSTPSLVLASTPTGAAGVGLHVPCSWLEERFGSPVQFAKLKLLIQQEVSQGATPSPPIQSMNLATDELVSPNKNLSISDALAEAAFVASETSEIQHLLDSVGVYCQSPVIRDRCEFDGISKQRGQDKTASLFSRHQVTNLHQLFLSLPEVATFKSPSKVGASATTASSVSFNALTGAIATLSCRSMVRYSAPFANHALPSIYIEPNFNALPPYYSQFVANQCTSEAQQAATGVEMLQVQTANNEYLDQLSQKSIRSSGGSQSPADPPAKASRVKWALPLIPLLPPVCSLASFSRPALARACLRNSRIIAFGDSTTQELLLQLIDFLETEDGEEPNDLTRMRVEPTAQGTRRADTEWMPPTAGSDGKQRYYYIEHWSPPDACNVQNLLSYMSRIFSTARFPSPYLSAYNITITMRWNVDHDPCSNKKGPDRASDIDQYRASYRWLRESCLPPNALDIVNKYRRRPDGTLRTSSEYVDEVNSKFHNTAHDGQIVYTDDPPPFGCSFPYLTTNEADDLTLAEWPLHLALVPSFDYAVANMGAHYANSWGNIEAQKVDDGYTYSPTQFHQSVESHLNLVQAFATNVIVRESAWKSDHSNGVSILLINKILREVTIEAQARMLQRDSELAGLVAIARRATIGGRPANLDSLLPPRRTVSWLPTFFTTAMVEKEDPDHCSFKNVGPSRDGIGGMRTPWCYPIIQNLIQLMCSAGKSKAS